MMRLDFTPELLLPAMTIPIALALAWRTWRLRRTPGVGPFVVLLGIAALWSTMNALELAAVEFSAKLFWSDAQYLPIAFMPVGWLLLALDYTGVRSWATLPRILLLLVVPLMTLFFLVTNQYHGLMRTDAWLVQEGSIGSIGRVFGPWFWVHVTYSYILSVVAVLILVDAARKVPPQYRAQPLLLLAGFAMPLLYNMVHVLRPGLLPLHDFTPAVFSASGLVVGYGLLKFRLFSLVPIARHTLVETMDDGLVVLDHERRVLDLNETARSLIGRPTTEVVGRALGEVWAGWEQLELPYAAGSTEAGLSLEVKGGRREYEVKMSGLVGHDHAMGRILHIRDVTERSHMEESLRRQALTDALTGLPNRTLFMARLDDAVRQARRNPGTAFAVVVIDLDRFKLVNDSVGHIAGDFLLEKVAAKLKSCVRDVDIVARMGGDEFMVLLHDVTQAVDVVPVIERIRFELKNPVHLDQHDLVSPASVGVALWKESFQGAEEVLRAADTAMYQAKEAGGCCYRIFDEEMHAEAVRALQAEVELRAAVRSNDFVLDYQPILDLGSGTVSSLEALIRWRHAQHGTILPGEFIKMAENSGLIVPLGALALEAICAQISRWRAPGCPATSLPISLNVSPRQLTEDDFVTAMLACMHEWRVEPHSIILEVTETALIRDPAKSKQAMLALREAGVRLCLDDFGTGWSSLRHLTTFPVQHLKIDRSFVAGISSRNTEFEIISSLTGLAHSIGLEVTGEGVENPVQLDLLAELGCDQAQGYYIGRPMSPESLITRLDELERGLFLPWAEGTPEEDETATRAPLFGSGAIPEDLTGRPGASVRRRGLAPDGLA